MTKKNNFYLLNSISLLIGIGSFIVAGVVYPGTLNITYLGLSFAVYQLISLTAVYGLFFYWFKLPIYSGESMSVLMPTDKMIAAYLRRHAIFKRSLIQLDSPIYKFYKISLRLSGLFIVLAFVFALYWQVSEWLFQYAQQYL